MSNTIFFKVLKDWGQFSKEQIIGMDQIPVGNDVNVLVQHGTIQPHDGEFPVAIDDMDVAGLKSRIAALESANSDLRTATVDAQMVQDLKDAKDENALLKGTIDSLTTQLQSYQNGSVPLGDWKQLHVQYEGVKAELESAKKLLEAGSVPVGTVPVATISADATVDPTVTADVAVPKGTAEDPATPDDKF